MPHPATHMRFAPSPSGWLHLGHAYSALLGAQLAAREGAEFLLRIEDIDQGRTREEYVRGIFEDLAWLGLQWPEPVMRQSTRMAVYERALRDLRDMDIVYPCFATRKEITDAINESGIGLKHWPTDPDGAPIYPGLYKDISLSERNRLMWEGRSYAWRLDLEKATALAERTTGGPITFVEEGESPIGQTGRQKIRPELFGDVIIARKDVPTSYHLAVVIDDAAQGVDLVTRGQDLFAATFIHRLLQILLGLPEPRYHHHGLIRDATGRRLSKTARDQGLRDLRAQGLTPTDIRRMIGLDPTTA